MTLLGGFRFAYALCSVFRAKISLNTVRTNG